MTYSLPLQSNQDVIFKSNTAPQLGGLVVHDKNTKGHPKRVNQEELSQ